MATQVDRAQCVEPGSAPGFVLRSDAARAFDRASAAFGKRLLLSGAWRSYATQEAIFRDRYRLGNHAGKAGYTTDVRTWKGQKWTRRAGTAAAAVPGTSNHGGGIAVDVKTKRSTGDPGHGTAVVFTGWNDRDRVKFLKVAKEHGWADDEGRRVNEPWHLTYYPARDKHRNEGGNPSGKIAVDGVWGRDLTGALQAAFGTPRDRTVSNQTAAWRPKNPGLTGGWDWTGKTGDGGSALIRAMQKWLGITQDGKAGPNFFTALQRKMGTLSKTPSRNGFLGNPSETVKALQRKVNEGALP